MPRRRPALALPPPSPPSPPPPINMLLVVGLLAASAITVIAIMIIMAITAAMTATSSTITPTSATAQLLLLLLLLLLADLGLRDLEVVAGLGLAFSLGFLQSNRHMQLPQCYVRLPPRFRFGRLDFLEGKVEIVHLSGS